jgi:hypothetical protein
VILVHQGRQVGKRAEQKVRARLTSSSRSGKSRSLSSLTSSRFRFPAVRSVLTLRYTVTAHLVTKNAETTTPTHICPCPSRHPRNAHPTSQAGKRPDLETRGPCRACLMLLRSVGMSTGPTLTADRSDHQSLHTVSPCQVSISTSTARQD